jgi:serine/threonine-protein kinase RsbT
MDASVMIQPSNGTLSLRHNQDVVICRQAVRRLAYERGFGLTGQTMLMTAASELARNALKYGGGGLVTYEVVNAGNCVGIRLVFEDHGPGIADIAQAMVNGWTSGRGLGLGLSGAKRLVHEFDIISIVGQGTTVTVLRWK